MGERVQDASTDKGVRNRPAFATSLQPSQDVVIPQELRDVGILEILAADPRSSFVVDLEDIRLNGWRPVYANNACLKALSCTLVIRDDDGSGAFRAWAGDTTAPDRPPHFRHNGKLWVSFDLRRRWRVLSGTELDPQPDDASSPALGSALEGTFSSASSWKNVSSRGSAAFFSTNPAEEQNWTDLLPDTPFIHTLFRPNDWRNTSLGSLAHWPYLLRRSTRFVLADPAPSCLFWGDKDACVFNAGYAEILGPARAARCLGRPGAEVWPEVWDGVSGILAEVRETRQSCGWNNVQYIIERNGRLTETYWNWNLIPLMEDRGMSSGFYSTVHETTQHCLSNRRQDTVLAPIHANDTVSFWQRLLENYEKNPWDAPFAAFYDIGRSRRPSMESLDSQDFPQRLVLRGSVGVPDGHPAFPTSSDLAPHGYGIIPYLAEAAGSRESLIMTADSHPSFFRLLRGIEWKGFGLPSVTVVIFCIRLGEEIIGFAVTGLNPRRPYNDDEHRYVNATDSHLSASLSSAALIERYNQTEARLQRRLALSLEQNEMTDARYRAITELSPLGMINIDRDGRTMYANRTWFEITGHQPEADLSKVNIRHIIHDEDVPILDEELDKMINGKQKRHYEVRLKKKRFLPETHQLEDRWILCTGGPEYEENGDVRSIIGCVADITAQKHAEIAQSRSRQAAEEARAAQEKFMDATSHEMRNPLSAILQSVDEMSAVLEKAVPQRDGLALFDKETVDTLADATNVIALCAQHQTRIVDDVLTMSKLDSHMLEVTPVPAQPLTVVRETMQMYHGELASNKIDTKLVVEPAYNDHKVDWVYCDPARLKQILINLVSNAIKFTREEETRRITINVSASVSKPPEVQVEGLTWFPSNQVNGSERIDLTEDPAWGDGEVVYIGVIVSDTGKGLTELERNKLFNRFAQANTLTHVHYGGSGLGLFISRELTEMQGGEVGVASRSGEGSSFAFYIKCKRTETSRPKLPIRTVSGQKVAQIAGILPDSQQQQHQHQGQHQQPARPLNGFVSTPPPALVPIVAPPSKTTGFNILVVEDNVVNQKVMTKQLVKAGCTVAIANHGQEALEYLEKTAIWSARGGQGPGIDVALVDIEMPVMNGLTCARRIREQQAAGAITCHLPLMAVTANARKEQIAECMRAGMDDVTIKPFKVNDLLIKIGSLLERRRSAQEISRL